LGEIGLSWKELPIKVQKSLEELLLFHSKDHPHPHQHQQQHHHRDLSAIGIQQIIIGSVKMNYKCFENISIRNHFYEKIIELFGKDIVIGDKVMLTYTILGMGKVGLKNKELPKDVLTAVTKGMEYYQSSFTKLEQKFLNEG
jgi:hypothetical protein